MNLTNLTRPVFSLDYIMQTKFTNLDGAALEYSIDGGITWNPVRNTDPGTGADIDIGIDWFTTQGFSSSVGDNSLYGWSGDLWNGAGSNITWLSGKHKLDFITPKNKVRFRLAFGSDAAAGTEFEGFAFTNVKVESRNRLLLIENFTNQNKTAANGVSYAQNKTDYDNITQLESVKMQYHLNYPSEDINSTINTADQTARSAYYGIVLTDANIPRTYIDGVSGGDITGGWADVRRGRRELIPSPIELEIKSEAAEVGYLKARVSIKALVDIPDAVVNLPKFKNMVVRMAVVEKTDQNSNQFVFRDFISSPIGISLYDSLPKVQGDSIVVMDSILIEDLSILATNLTDLSLVAYVQDDSTREVYQAAIDLNPVLTINPVTSTEDPEYAEKINLYPNPASNLVNIQLPNVVVRNTPVVFFDAFGRSVYQNSFSPGERNKSVSTSELTGGIYIVQIGTPDGGVARRKVMVVH
jgi:hypothetical protein